MYLSKYILFFFVSVGFAIRSKDYALFHRHRGKYLSNSVIRTVLANTETECAIYCSSDKECASANYKATGKDRGLCELNDKTLSGEATGVNRKEYNYLEILHEPTSENLTPPKSCKEILIKLPEAASGLYDISIDKKMVKVYCEMTLYGGGFTFIPKSAVRNETLPNLVTQLFTNQSEVLLYIRNKNGSQTYTLIQQLGNKSHIPLVLLQNTYTGHSRIYSEPENSGMLDYLYLSTSVHIDGFLSNNIEVKYVNAEGYPIRSYFAFFPNHRGEAVSTYFIQHVQLETFGVAVDWRNTGIISGENLPTNFFFLTEVHYGGGGCYTSSDRWVEANGTAIGLR